MVWVVELKAQRHDIPQHGGPTQRAQHIDGPVESDARRIDVDQLALELDGKKECEWEERAKPQPNVPLPQNDGIFFTCSNDIQELPQSLI